MPELIYINFKGMEMDKYVYEFLFSETPEIVYGPWWGYPNPSICGNIAPDESTYSIVKTVKTTYKLKTAQENTCYSMEYVMNGIIALGWIEIEGLEEYPENGRMVFHYGDSMEKVTELLGLYDYTFEPDTTKETAQ
jgi:hypothetical protein